MLNIVLAVCAIIFTSVMIIVLFEAITTLRSIRTASDAFTKLVKDIDDDWNELKPIFKGVNSISKGISIILENVLLKIISLFNKR